MAIVKTKYIPTNVGVFKAQASNTHLIRICLPDETEEFIPNISSNELLDEFERQLIGYLKGFFKTFTLPIFLNEPPFRTHVLKQIQQIPYGETRSYQDLAKALKKPKASRAIGQACRKNPLPIVVPCHRVLGVHGQLTGYIGGLELKRYLLALEEAIPLTPFLE